VAAQAPLAVQARHDPRVRQEPRALPLRRRRGRPRAVHGARSRRARRRPARGKRPSDTWWHTIVHTTGREKTGYPTQKPLGIVRRMVAASSRPGGWCLDPFAGRGRWASRPPSWAGVTC
jgi:DNA modification methylase